MILFHGLIGQGRKHAAMLHCLMPGDARKRGGKAPGSA
jgi:hypothetical protein